MFDDPQKNLGQLQKELLAEDDANKWLDDELAETRRLLDGDVQEPAATAAEKIRNFANGYGEADYEDEPEEAPENVRFAKLIAPSLVIPVRSNTLSTTLLPPNLVRFLQFANAYTPISVVPKILTLARLVQL